MVLRSEIGLSVCVSTLNYNKPPPLILANVKQTRTITLVKPSFRPVHRRAVQQSSTGLSNVDFEKKNIMLRQVLLQLRNVSAMYTE